MRKLISLIATAILLFSAPINADTVIQIDTPNPGDTTTTVTTSTTTAHTTGNLITQDFTDGSWEGTNQDSRHGSGTIAGIGGEYVESTITQSDIGLTDAQIQRGFTSTLGADIWFWDGTQDQSVTMTQSYDDKLGNITTQNRVVDYDSSYYNTYTDTITVGTNLSTEGEATVRFDFTHTNTTSHRAADLKLPTLTIDYTNIATSSSTTIEYCWEKTPTTCPAQEEIAAVEDTIEQIDIEEEWKEEFYDPYKETDIITYDTNMVEYDWEDDWEEDWEEDYETSTILIDDYSYETDIDFEIDFKLDRPSYEEEQYEYEELPIITMAYNNEPTEEYKEELNTDKIIEDYVTQSNITNDVETGSGNKPIEDTTSETLNEKIIEEPYEEIAMVDKPSESVSNTVNEEFISEEVTEEKIEVIEEEVIEEEIIEEVVEEEIIEEEIIEEEIIEEEIEVVEEQEITESESEVYVDIVQVEKFINAKVKSQIERVEATLIVINELVSQEMIKHQPNIDSYANINNALFDNRQLPDGNMDFFNQINLESYQKTIYDDPSQLIAMVGTDATVVYEQKLEKARDKTDKKYFKLQELINARNNI